MSNLRSDLVAADTAEATVRAAADLLRLLKSGDTMTGDLAMGGHKVTGLADPTADQDAATRGFVLAQIAILLGGAPPAVLDTILEIATQLQSDETAAGALTIALATETTNRQNADALLIPLAQRAAANGVATLDASTRLPYAQRALLPVVAKAVDYTLTATDEVVVVTATGKTMTLPSAVTAGAGRRYTVKLATAGTVTVASAAGNIDDDTTFTFTSQYASFDFLSDGTNWWVV